MKKIYLFLLLSILSACGAYNAVDTMKLDEDARDIARCGGGLGISNKVGLIIKKEAAKTGGELSASQSSDIFAKAIEQGLSPLNEKNYSIYEHCILELDKRRNDRATLERTERIQQPVLKVYLESVAPSSQERVSRRLVIENTGEDLTELQVTPAPFLLTKDLCVVRERSACTTRSSREKLERSYIPIENYYSNIVSRGNYRGELYSVYEDAPAGFFECIQNFTKAAAVSRTGSMNGQVITLVRVRYKDKFQDLHERFFDVSNEQRELPKDLGRSLYAVREDWQRAGMAVDAHDTSIGDLHHIWDKTRRAEQDLLVPWVKYLEFKDNA